jgi:hypothetical protein
MSNEQFKTLSAAVGTWVSEKQYAEIFGIDPQTLANHRYYDKRASRTAPRDGYPTYRKIGGAVRYLLPPVLAGNGSVMA